ncbi:MAG: c-type cytochrome [Polyangiaceae bacterium]|nr:c-type cytochrome [Polyangiaceae bacterium]
MLRVVERVSWGVSLGLAMVAGCTPPPTASSPPQHLPPSEPAHITKKISSNPGTTGPLFEAAGSCQRLHPRVGARRFGPVRTSGTVALAASEAGADLRVVAYVADGDEPLLHTIDVGQGRQLTATPLRGAPEQVLVLADGRVAVTLRQSSEVQILEPATSPETPLASLCVLSVPTEPIALAESPDGKKLALTSAWSRTLTLFDASTLTAQTQVELPREPRSVVISDDGRRAFVAHVVNATLSVVDLDAPDPTPRAIDLKVKPLVSGTRLKERSGCQGFALVSSVDMPHDPSEVGPAPRGEQPPSITNPPPTISPVPGPPARTRPVGRIFAPFVTVDPGDTSQPSSGYGNLRAALPTELSAVSVVDATTERLFTRTLTSLMPQRRPTPQNDAPSTDCLLPRAAAYADGSLFVACQGNDTLVEYDARAIDPARAERRRWKAPAGPGGVALDTVHGIAVVHGVFDHKLTLVSLRSNQPSRDVALARPAKRSLTPEQERGRILFHTAHDPRISNDGRACASCHPDGRDDALTWATPEGPRQTLMLQGRLRDSAPYGWSGASKTVEDHLHFTFRRLGGTGLPEESIRAIVAYLNVTELPRPGRPTRWEAQRQALVDQGRELFVSPDTACASCHPHGLSDGQNHAVSSSSSRLSPLALDTPSLRGIRASAPYFHDGRYPTLHAMLEATDHAMGYSLHLDRQQRLALAAYLESL